VPIEDIKVGDEVLAKDGSTAIQSREKVVVEVPENTEIFGIDDGVEQHEPFFRAGHMFWTPEGWKALQPETALMENPDRSVTKLEEGDCIYRVKGIDPLSYEKVEIKGFTKGILTERGKLYGMHLVDGPRSYHAGGFLVGMNYPLLTQQRLTDGLNKLTDSERRTLRQNLRPVLPVLNAAIGPFLETAVTTALSDTETHNTTEGKTKSARAALIEEFTATHSGIDLQRMNRTFQIRMFDRDEMDFVERADASEIELAEGKLFIDGEEVPKPKFGPDFVAFCANNQTRHVSGVLNFTPDAMAVFGTLFAGTNAKTVHDFEIAGVAPSTTYHTRIGISGASPPPHQHFPRWSPPVPRGWTKSINFTQSYKFIPGKLPQPVFEIEGQDVTSLCSTSIDKKTSNLLISFDMQASLVEQYVEKFGADAPVSFTIEIATSGVTFKGAARKAVKLRDGLYTHSEEYAFEGKWDEQTVQFAKTSRRHHEKSLSDEPLNAVTAGIDLGITRLYTLQVDPKQLQRSQFHVLIENMKWALGNDPAKKSLLRFFGELPPDLPKGPRTDLIQKDASFYTENMVTSYLGSPINKMTGAGAPSTHLTGAQQTDLEFYLRAGLPADPAFGRQTHGMFLTAFTESTGGLSDYIDDQKWHTHDGKIDPAHNWGAKLYAALVQPERLNMTFNGVMSGFGMANFNRHTALLMALEPTGELAKKYHKLFLTRALAASISHLNLSKKKPVQSWLELAIDGLVTVVSKKNVKLPVDAATAKQLHELAQEVEDAVDQAGGIAELAEALADLVVAVQGALRRGEDFWDVLRAVESSWEMAGYVFARSIYVIAILGGLIAAVVAFLNWNKLSDVEKGEAITGVVTVVAKIAESLKGIFTGEWSFTSSVQLELATSTPDTAVPLLENTTKEQIEDATGEVGDMVDAEERMINPAGSRFAQYFETAGGIFDATTAIIGAAAAAAFAVLSTVSFIEDLINHASVSTTVLDGIIAAANIGVAIALGVSFLFAFLTVPILGAVCAIIGVIAALIELLIPQPKPETPAEKFMQNNLIPAMSGTGAWILPAPAAWTTDQPVPKHNAYNPGAVT
jgi:hypothetical protein